MEERDFEYVERHIIGACMNGTAKASNLKLTPSNFMHLGALFAVVLRLDRDGVPEIDAAVLSPYLAEIDDLAFYSYDDLASWQSMSTTAASVMQNVRRLRDVSLEDELSHDLADLLATERLTGPQLLQETKALVQRYSDRYPETGQAFKFLREFVPGMRAIYDDMHRNISHAITTGFPSFDNVVLDGWSRSDLHLLVGFTSHGKSALAWNCAKRQSAAGHVPGVVSREMSAYENLMRLQANDLRLPRYFIRKGLPSTDLHNLTENLDEIAKWPIMINVETSTIEALAIETRIAVLEHGLDILYVDTVQLMRSMRQHARKDLEMGAVSGGLKEIAVDNDIVVVGLSQFSRGAKNASIYQLLDHLKESSSLEQDSTSVTAVKLEKKDAASMSKMRPATLTTLKNRNGDTFRPIKLNFTGEIFDFQEDL